MLIPGLTIVRKPLETYLVVRELPGSINEFDRELTPEEWDKVMFSVNFVDNYETQATTGRLFDGWGDLFVAGFSVGAVLVGIYLLLAWRHG